MIGTKMSKHEGLLAERISTLRITTSARSGLEKILSEKKQSLGSRGNNIKVQDIIRDAIDFYIRYNDGEFSARPDHLEQMLKSISDMQGDISEAVSFIKFLKIESGIGNTEKTN